MLPLSGGASSSVQNSVDAAYWIKHNFRWINNLDYQKYNVNWVECVQEKSHRKTGEKCDDNRFVFLTNMVVDKENVADITLAGRARWLIEDHFNTQKNRGGNLHHKFSRSNFNAIKNWHNTRQIAFLIRELVKHSAEIKEHLKSKGLTWQAIWEIVGGFLYYCFVEELMEAFEIWCKSPRQIRLE